MNEAGNRRSDQRWAPTFVKCAMPSVCWFARRANHWRVCPAPF